MFGLAEKLIEVLASSTTALLRRRQTTHDAQVARVLLGIVLLLQDLCVHGTRLLGLARRFVAQDTDATTEAEFDRALGEQVALIGQIRDELSSARVLLATIDADLYLKLAPFLDAKSGLLTRWEQQRRSSTFSTTTLFFLPPDSLESIVSAGAAGATVNGLASDRGDYVMAMADTIRTTRSGEVRDIRRLDPAQSARLSSDIDQAEAALQHASDLCGRMLIAVEEAVGPAAMADVRRSTVRQSKK